jgi:type VI secretion system protein ImpA
MPVDIESLLQPISGEQPSGDDLRYNPVTDKIKEARRQDDTLAQGVWERELKSADYVLVIKLAKEALTKQSKDLQIAAWLTEALVRREGFAGLQQGLQLIQKLLDNFWDTIYPQIDEDGEMDLRATPLSWVGQLGTAVRSAPLTSAGHNWYQYRESRAIPNEQDSLNDPGGKGQKRTEAIADGQIPPEDFDKGLETTPVAFSQKVYDDLGTLQEQLESLKTYCDDKFGEASPNLGPLQISLEEVHQVARILLMQKGGLRSSSASVEEAEEIVNEGGESDGQGFVEEAGQSSAAAPQKVRRRASAGAEPADADDAIERLLSAARFLRRENPHNATPYLISRALRWGEIRSVGGYPEPMFLAPPPSEVRMELKRLSLENQWEQVREAAEEAAGAPCGRAWLDVHRYAVTACRNTGVEQPALAIVSGLRAMLADFPQMTQWTLADDTPAANAETMQWLTGETIIGSAAPVSQEPAHQEWYPPPASVEPVTAGEPAPPEPYELAMQAARGGRIEDAFNILSHEISQERSGRARFMRRIQLAQVCLATGNQAIALPILQELSDEIEKRELEAWEDPETVAQPLALLYRGLPLTDEDADQRRKLYARICRLDPGRALALQR